jgi:carbon monoxide dehydrogenase subunit G
MISNAAEPQGSATVGQKNHAVGKMAGRKVEIFTEITAAEPEKRLVVSQSPGGLFKAFSSTVTLEPTKKGTRATQRLSYDISMGYLGKALNGILVNRFVRKNAKAYLQNLKEIAELKEMPK